ncbi:hypothetical protein XhyaCFBP1156_18775 [Xanthomonas hyacinthi]|uniref:Uncharacterized protein n=2 Tax=Xanthomonas hyacinthi TaxID=56455 RepID=A0A2S7EQM8_9XANT|nr:hypothetical protein XhyaCFBP1156_18775 [Xanthomonas hyacinthi]
MATVAPAAVVNRTNKMSAERLYGVPTQSFIDTADAVDWLLAHLRETFAELNETAIKLRAPDLASRAIAEVH